MSTSDDRKDSIQQVFAKNKPKFITVAVLVGALCATFFIQPTEEKYVNEEITTGCVIAGDFTYQSVFYPKGKILRAAQRCELLLEVENLSSYIEQMYETRGRDVTDRSSEWFARIAIFLFSGALSAALLLLFMTQKKISASIKVSEKMLTDTDESDDYAQSADDESLTNGLMHSQVMPEEQDRKYEVFDLDSQQSKKLDDENIGSATIFS